MKFCRSFLSWCDKISRPLNCDDTREPECEHTFQLTNELFKESSTHYLHPCRFFTLSICTKCGKPRRVYE